MRGLYFFYNLGFVSTFLCKGSRHCTHIYAGWEWGPRGPLWFNSIWQNPLGRAEAERKMERAAERYTHAVRGLRETLQGPLRTATVLKWELLLSVCPQSPPCTRADVSVPSERGKIQGAWRSRGPRDKTLTAASEWGLLGLLLASGSHGSVYVLEYETF